MGNGSQDDLPDPDAALTVVRRLLAPHGSARPDRPEPCHRGCRTGGWRGVRTVRGRGRGWPR
ncbi:hypothetical protein KCH_07410 [Kitasatospora cheerisanensis KCTC 2395]|uniref:Acyl-CoA carboxylase subunit epsilon n=1 Tax=Kitasatospora cheerisanensis KCTC 2395 TaxID=1348663 RepID=A0A066ZBJ2_9ACTN|nr:hypothetical protein KCH_07410 [Kitasatospora cheerisanensis KCTC 2395]